MSLSSSTKQFSALFNNKDTFFTNLPPTDFSIESLQFLRAKKSVKNS